MQRSALFVGEDPVSKLVPDDADRTAEAPLWVLPPFGVGHRWEGESGPGAEPGDVEVQLRPEIRTFESLSPILDLLKLGSRDDHRRLLEHLARCGRGHAHDGSDPDVAFALSRRLSREGGPITRAIELGARLLNERMRGTGISTIKVHGVRSADTATVKLLARAATLAADGDLRYVWTGLGARDLEFRPDADPADIARTSVLQAAARNGAFVVSGGPAGVAPSTEIATASSLTRTPLADAARALLDHNFEWTIRLADGVRGDDEERAQALRLRALAVTNLGLLESGAADLAEARTLTRDRCLAAHLAFLQALLASKRKLALDAASAYVDDGLAALASGSTTLGDEALERAWLLNARALSCALRWRIEGKANLRVEAERLVIVALQTVASGLTSERSYLRFNLLANLAYLYELDGRPGIAAGVFAHVFERFTPEDPAARAALAYRVGLLRARAGDVRGAREAIESVPVELLPIEEWSTAEHLLRLDAHVSGLEGKRPELVNLHREGLRVGIAARSARAVEAHGVSLLDVLAEDGCPARDAIERELSDVGVDVTRLESVPLPSKIPPYQPEIDLAAVPPWNVGQVLATGRPTR